MIAQLQKFKVLLIGDSCFDKDVYVENIRDNPEGNTPLLSFVSEAESLGMVHNVHRCLSSLIGRVDIVYPVQHISIKTRYVDAYTGKQWFRVDQDQVTKPIDIDTYDINDYDTVVISDYNKGFITTEVIQKIIKRAKCPVFLDTKKTNLSDFEGCFIKINAAEADAANMLPMNTVVTTGACGAYLASDKKHKGWPALDIECVDVCGAGDAFLAGYVYGYLETGSITRAVPYGIVNSGISVTKPGTYAPTLKELEEGLEKYAKQCG